jgi:hypothetical protein
MKMANGFSIHVQTWNIEACESHFKKREGGKGRIMEEDEPNWGTFYAYMEMSRNPLCNYYILIKMLRKRNRGLHTGYDV